MTDEGAKRAAEEFLAGRLAEEGQNYEDQLNRAAAISLAPVVWKRVIDAVNNKCAAWNEITREETLTCRETVLGDLRIRCAGRSQLLTVHYDSKNLLVIIKNTARAEHETDVVLQIQGYAATGGRDARLVRNNHIVNLDMLIVGELRVLAGMNRQTET